MHHPWTFLWGLSFSVLQYFNLFSMESGLAARVPIYLAVISGWLLRTWISLNFTRMR